MIPELNISGRTFRQTGHQLTRPECVVAHISGLLMVPNWSDHGGISLINSQHQTFHILSKGPFRLRPNGIALEAHGSVLLAHMGDTEGSIVRLFPDGSTEPCVTSVNGEPMPPANFVVKDTLGRIWITVSTRRTPRALDYRPDANSGFIAVALPGESNATIVADGLGYTNECVIDEVNGHIHVNETFGRRLTRFQMSADKIPVLSRQHCVLEFGEATYPDGLAMDAEGNLWVTSIISNRILRIHPDGHSQIVFEDSVKEHLQWTEQAFTNGALDREHLDTAQSAMMQNISNLAFGGKDLDHLYLGNLLGNTLPYLQVDVSGAPMTHWDVPLGELASYLHE